MPWSNKSLRKKFTAEKSHSLSFSVRVEDRRHMNILGSSDQVMFTVRDTSSKVGTTDSDIVTGTSSAPGNGIVAEGVLVGTGEDRVFRVAVQAAAMNLDPLLDWWYDITYVVGGYSVSVASGPFEVVANPVNRTATSTFTAATIPPDDLVLTLQDRHVLNVTATMPLPQQGVPGTSIYTTYAPLNTTPGQSGVYQRSHFTPPAGRGMQIGDLVVGYANGVIGEVLSFPAWNTVSVVSRIKLT